MSPRAAWRLESLGFHQVFDYVAGKSDWLANGLPSEGRLSKAPRAADVVRRDVPICRLNEHLGAVGERVQAAGWDMCLVVNNQNVLLGRLRPPVFQTDPVAVAEVVMEEGPTTVRPNEPLAALAKRLAEHEVSSTVVTTPDGVLLGVLFRKDAEQMLSKHVTITSARFFWRNHVWVSVPDFWIHA